MYLFRFQPNQKITVENDEIWDIEEFRKVIKTNNLGDRWMKYIAYYADLYSPFRYFEEGVTRQDEITRRYEGKKGVKFWGYQVVKDAIECYKFLQVDPVAQNVQSLIQLQHRINLEINRIATDGKMDSAAIVKALDIAKKSEDLEESIRRGNDQLEKRNGRLPVKGERILSWFEQRKLRLKELQEEQNRNNP